ncbi:hypothetical protein PBN151_2389 [Paenibacillus sp. NAIST15-1]|nr:hypothetical protein PBN151_2389 [Paenibacillus sp. NAIST15-1]
MRVYDFGCRCFEYVLFCMKMSWYANDFSNVFACVDDELLVVIRIEPRNLLQVIRKGYEGMWFCLLLKKHRVEKEED